jgi:hypothetical protein
MTKITSFFLLALVLLVSMSCSEPNAPKTDSEEAIKLSSKYLKVNIKNKANEVNFYDTSLIASNCSIQFYITDPVIIKEICNISNLITSPRKMNITKDRELEWWTVPISQENTITYVSKSRDINQILWVSGNLISYQERTGSGSFDSWPAYNFTFPEPPDSSVEVLHGFCESFRDYGSASLIYKCSRESVEQMLKQYHFKSSTKAKFHFAGTSSSSPSWWPESENVIPTSKNGLYYYQSGNLHPSFSSGHASCLFSSSSNLVYLKWYGVD